jgi:CheY-like chemotaxis protein
VLLADADAAAADGLRAWLEAWGARVESATNVAEACRLARAGSGPGFAHIVIADESLMGGDALGLARALRDGGVAEPSRLLLVGARTAAAEHERLLAAGADGWLARPWRATSLATVCGRLLGPDRTGFATREAGAGPVAGAPERPDGQLVPSVGDALMMLSGPSLLSGTRVLIVEDNLTNQRVAQRMLERAGCFVSVAFNGREGLDAFRTQPFDLVFMDCQMPEMDGYEATRAIRELEGPSRHTPIVALTANAMEGDRENCLACGMDDFVAKPVQRDLMLAAVERWRHTAGGPASARAA